MKFICPCSQIKEEIEYAINFTSQKNSLSIASNVLLENHGDTLTIKATDQKVSFTSSISVTTIIPGSTTVFCDKLLAVLKNMPDEDLEFSEEDNKITIKPTNNKINVKINLKTMDASKYPELITCDSSLFFSLPQKEFLDMADKTSFAVSEETTRFFLTGVFFEKKDDKVIMVATDGRRLAYIDNKIEYEIPDFPSAIIPVKFLQLVKLISTGEGIFSLAVTTSHIFATINNRTISSNLISGKYPNYSRVIPTNCEYHCKLNVSEIEKSISLVSIFSESKSKKIFVDISIEGVMISGENNDFGDSKQIIHCEYNGPSIKVSFNSTLLLPTIKKIEGEYFDIKISSSNGAMIFSPEPEKNYLFVLMPMQAWDLKI